MLESLGYSEAPERARGRSDPLQHLLDPRDGRQPLHRAPRRGEAAQARRARARRRRRRLLGAVGQGGGVRALPVRRRRVRPGAGAQARRVPDQRLATAQGYFEFEGFTGDLPAHARAPVPGLAADQRRLQLRCSYCIVPSTRGREVSRPLGELVAEVAADGRRRRARGHAARPERQLLRTRPALRRRARASRSCSRALDAVDGHRADPLHEPAPEGHARGRDPRPRRAGSALRAHPPAAAVGLEPRSSRRCAAPTTASATWTASR